MTVYRCLICGDPYMGTEAPSHCPFCGAVKEYLVAAAEWRDENLDLGELSDGSRRNLEAALQLEANNTLFYRDAMARTGDIELQGIFKYLAKVEAEHASTIMKMLRTTEMPGSLPGKGTATDDDRANLEEAHGREVAAASFYGKASSMAPEPRVSRVFKALSEVESDHIALEEALLARR